MPRVTKEALEEIRRDPRLAVLPPSPPPPVPPVWPPFDSLPKKASLCTSPRQEKDVDADPSPRQSPYSTAVILSPEDYERARAALAMGPIFDEIAIALNDWFNERKAEHEKRAADWRRQQHESVYYHREEPPWIYAEEMIRRDDAERLEPIRQMMRKSEKVLVAAGFP